MMSLKIIALSLMASVQVACCSQSFSYPVIVDVTEIDVTSGANNPTREIKDGPQIERIVRFIDERRSRWCSPRFDSLPNPEATLYLYANDNRRSAIGFGAGFLVAEFADGKYKMDISGDEEQEFLTLLGVSKEQVFSR